MRWSYKTVHFELKKEGLLGSAFLDESEIEQALNEYGQAGWELMSMLETRDGLIAVFKQPLDMSPDFQPRHVAENRDAVTFSSRRKVAPAANVEKEATAMAEPEPIDEHAAESEDNQTDLGSIRIE